MLRDVASRGPWVSAIIFTDGLHEVPARCGELASRPSKLLKQEIREARVRRGNADGVLQTLVANEHGASP
jgi:hypothetical protein